MTKNFKFIECGCSTKGSDTTDCDKTTGQCKCRKGFEGKKCDKCKKNVTYNGWCTWVTGGCKCKYLHTHQYWKTETEFHHSEIKTQNQNWTHI